MSDLQPKGTGPQPAPERTRDQALDEELFDAIVGERPAVREGLPPTYRMRHDAHYVDQLSQPAAPPVRMIAVNEIDGARPAAAREIGPLVQSISRFGLLQPLLVRRHSGRYELIAGARRLAAAVAAGLTEVPCVLHDADESKARALSEAANTRAAVKEEPPVARQASSRVAIPAAALADVGEHLDALASCLNLFENRDRVLRERVAMQLMRVEIQRAAWLSQGLSVLAEDPVLARADVDVPELLRRIVGELQPERALVGLNLVIEQDDQVPAVHADERLLSIAMAGGLAAMRAITERVRGGLLHCAVRADSGGGSVVVEISQNTVTFPASRLARFFDIGWAERPGGYRAAVGILAARRIAELHAGKLEVIAADEGGCTLRMELPAETVSGE